MAVVTFFNNHYFSSNKNYWKHIFATPGVPVWLLPIMIPVEILGMFTKPFALMVRLFANITAGHIIIFKFDFHSFSLFGTAWASLVSIPFTLFISCLELFGSFCYKPMYLHYFLLYL
ncbi:ATP synthase subunit a 2 (fragment) [Capnocytophaga canimorsus]|uniref:ATP synthase subunit a 2 n=1 Tax=Capnocytophaga canimorsus TaxID=28188 RepID=A0A0B7IKE4_9FLAO